MDRYESFRSPDVVTSDDDLIEGLTDEIRRHPLAALVVAAGIGAGVALLAAGSSDDEAGKDQTRRSKRDSDGERLRRARHQRTARAAGGGGMLNERLRTARDGLISSVNDAGARNEIVARLAALPSEFAGFVNKVSKRF